MQDKQTKAGFRFKLGLFFLLFNIPFGYGGLAISSAIGASTGNRLWFYVGIGFYVTSWLMLGLGIVLAGKEGYELSKKLLRKWFGRKTTDRVAIIDYGAGNLTSVKLAFDALDIPAEITRSPEVILAASRVVFPGVGAAGAAMTTLQKLALADVIRQVVLKGTPFLGICLGTQIIFDRSEEDGGTACLGIIPGTVKLFTPAVHTDKVPQIGWNSVHQTRPHPVLEGIEDNSEFYFVHSYYPAPADNALVLGETEYAGSRFASIVARDNLVATQFHPEKSGRIGMKLLANFCRWEPTTPPREKA